MKTDRIKQRFYILTILTMMLLTYYIGIRVGEEQLLRTERVSETSSPHISVTPAQPTPTPIIIEEKPAEEIEYRYGFTEDEIYLLAQLLCGDKTRDGDGEYDIDYQQDTNYYEVSKVLNIVMNRVNSCHFPDTVTDVVMQEGQFVVMPRNAAKIPSDKAIAVIRAWCNSYDNSLWTQSIPVDHLFYHGDGETNITRATY